MKEKKLDNNIMNILNRIKDALLNRYGEKIKGIVLYGSYARGEANEDSDIDLLVLVDDSLEPSNVEDNMSKLLFDILLEEGELVSMVVLHESSFKKYNYPLHINIKKEGIWIWGNPYRKISDSFSEEIRDIIKKSEITLSTAESAYTLGDYSWCVYSSYYAMFHIAQAVLLTKGITPRNHRELINLFIKHFVDTGVFDKEMGEALAKGYRLKLIEDYGITSTVSENEAKELLNKAREFVGKSKRYLGHL